MKTHQRTLSDEEKQRLKRSLPWFGKRRQDRLADIEQGLADVYEFEINRIWDINGCRPPCCPYTILFETTDDLFVYIESWDEIERQENVTDESELVIESTPLVKRLIKSRIEGQRPINRRYGCWFVSILHSGQVGLLRDGRFRWKVSSRKVINSSNRAVEHALGAHPS